jgi:predicted nucleic acid-binding protein
VSTRPFLDTNVLVYAFAAGDPRQAAAEEALSKGGVISVQVLNEFVNVSSRKLGLSWREIEQRVAVLTMLLGVPAPLTIDEHIMARKIARTRKIGFYDALIIAAALSCDCDELLSEDFQADARFGRLRVKNPFASRQAPRDA